MERETIFISHATPDDNDFVRWLGNRLVGYGYRVWADIFELKGGTPFWATIEEAIREGTIKFVFVVSKTSVDPSRTGVLNELALADTIGKQLRDPSFIVPIRIDDTPFHALPIQIHRLNTLDFSRNWGNGLKTLLDTLSDAGVPKAETDQEAAFRNWKDALDVKGAEIERKTEHVMTNLLEIRSLPQRINFFEYFGPKGNIQSALKGARISLSYYFALIISFADTNSLQMEAGTGIIIKPRATVSLDEFLSGALSDPTSPARREAKNIIVGFVRDHIEAHLVSLGLLPYETANGLAFYFPSGLVSEDNWVSYTTLDGKKARKKVVGRSEKYGIHWHLAMKISIAVGDDIVVRLKPYVCFSENGRDAIEDPKRTSALRRRFCKSWWNPHWRQLLEAFIAFLGQGEELIRIEAGDCGSIDIVARPITMTTIASISKDVKLISEPVEIADPDDDDADDASDDEGDE